MKKICNFLSGSFGKFSKTLRGNNALAKSSLEVAESTRKQNEIIIELLNQQKKDNSNMNAYIQAKIPAMGKYFPLPDVDTLMRFMDDSDGLYSIRRAEFFNYLTNCATNKKNLFGTAIMQTLFSNDFLRVTTWPTNNARNPKAKDFLIPHEFVALLKSTLSRMTGVGILDYSFVNLDFWRAWPKKYREAKRYAKSSVGEQDEDDDEEEEEEEEPPVVVRKKRGIPFPKKTVHSNKKRKKHIHDTVHESSLAAGSKETDAPDIPRPDSNLSNKDPAAEEDTEKENSTAAEKEKLAAAAAAEEEKLAAAAVAEKEKLAAVAQKEKLAAVAAAKRDKLAAAAEKEKSAAAEKKKSAADNSAAEKKTAEKEKERSAEKKKSAAEATSAEKEKERSAMSENSDKSAEMEKSEENTVGKERSTAMEKPDENKEKTTTETDACQEGEVGGADFEIPLQDSQTFSPPPSQSILSSYKVISF